MFRKALIIMIFAEGLSFAAFNFPVLILPLLAIAGVGTLYLSWSKPEWGIYILFGELFIGSRGHLFEYDLGVVSVSLRLVIFAAVFIAWILKFQISNFKYQIIAQIPNHKFQLIYFLLLSVIGFGILNGFLHNNTLGNIFNDMNGYLYLLILPAALSAIKTREQIRTILQILGAAIVIIAAKTLGLFLWFTFSLGGVVALYHWIITQDFGEITGDVGKASRIFMQSQFYALVGVFIFSVFTLPLPLPSREGNKKENSSLLAGEVRRGGVLNWVIIFCALLSVLMSLSRSFWLGAAVGGLFSIIIVFWYFRANFWAFWALGLKLGAIAILEIIILYGIIVAGGGGVAGAVASRGVNPAQEAAGSARLLLLPELVNHITRSPIFGAGFGTVVSYKSYLPDRVTTDNPDGEITNFAFEWGYLDIILKLGVVGLCVYLFFLARIFRLGWSLLLTTHNLQTLGLLSGLVALLALNITTPYLNHPLGIGYLILCLVIFNSEHSDVYS